MISLIFNIYLGVKHKKRRMLHNSVFRAAEAIIAAIVMLIVTPFIIIYAAYF